MVLVALVGLGLGMYQLFHLQKELAELREVSLERALIRPPDPWVQHNFAVCGPLRCLQWFGCMFSCLFVLMVKIILIPSF